MKAENIIQTYSINKLPLQTGDILCLAFDTSQDKKLGDYWRILGVLIPGEVDHVAIYLGPGGRCVEASAKGVYTFNLVDQQWTPKKMFKFRGKFKDRLIGVAYPLHNLEFSIEEETKIRLAVAEYCLKQAESKKPYNINLLDPHREDAFYCGQLAYKAYLPHGIDLNTNKGVSNLPGTDRIIFPQEIWKSCFHLKNMG